MGRELKRVSVKFDWPLKQIWKGYVFPFKAMDCYGCYEEDKKESLGYSKRAQELNKEWYAFDNANYIEYTDEYGRDRRYNDNALMHHLTQGDVQALVDEGRLWDFTHTWTKEGGWVENDPLVVPTAEEVNEWSKKGMGHDSLNEGIVVSYRCKLEGVSDTCDVCQGEGRLWQSKEIEKLADEWESIDPPKGRGWQLWEDVSEGSPITPVFKTPQELIDHLVNNGDAWNHKWTKEQAEGLIGKKYLMSGMMTGGKFYKAEESAAL